MSILNRLTQNTAAQAPRKPRGIPEGTLNRNGFALRHPTGDYGTAWNATNRAAKIAKCKELISWGQTQEAAAKQAFPGYTKAGRAKWIQGLLAVNGGAK